MIRIRKHYTLLSLKKKWLSFEKSGGIHSFQTYELYRLILGRKRLRILLSFRFVFFYEILDGDSTKMIVPMCKKLFTNDYTNFGGFGGFEGYDLIYNHNENISNNFFYLSELIEKLGADKIEFSRVRSDSILHPFLQSEHNKAFNLQSRDNVNICIGNSYDEYYHSLSKHQRQNIRTAYNRCKADNIDIIISFICKKNQNQKELNKALNLYADRQIEKYGTHREHLLSASSYLFFVKHLSATTHYLRYYKDSVNALLYMNGEVAAAILGVMDTSDSRYLVPRLAIDEKMERYSPGIILINEVAKTMYKTFGVENLDLGLGTEGYKLAMGGKVYHEYDIQIFPKNSLIPLSSAILESEQISHDSTVKRYYDVEEALRELKK